MKNNTEINNIIVSETNSYFDLSRFRQAIEVRNDEEAINMIEMDNRYLINVNSGSPTIIQPMFRFNALHLAVSSKNITLTQFILSYVSDLKFLRKLYPDTSNEFLQDRSHFFLETFLNTPSKRYQETPLHIAVKSCLVDIVEILVSYSQCNTNALNSKNETPKDLVIKYKEDSNDSEYTKIFKLLSEPFYVPVLRYKNETLPVVGEPFEKTCPKYHKITALSPEPEVHAYAGPMTLKEAQQFYRKLKTPPRLTTKELNDNRCLKKKTNISLRFSEKGLERIGNNLAKEVNTDWNEYWPFLDTFTDLSTKKGLMAFESFLSKRRIEFDRKEENKNYFKYHEINSVTQIDSEAIKIFPFKCFEIISKDICAELNRMVLEFTITNKVNSNYFKNYMNLKRSGILNEEQIRFIHYRTASFYLNDFNYEKRSKIEYFLRVAQIKNFDVSKLTECIFQSVLSSFSKNEDRSELVNDSLSSCDYDNNSKLKSIFINKLCTCSFSKITDSLDNSNDSDESSHYSSARSSISTSEELFEDVNTFTVFIEGLKPTKSDLLAFGALENIEIDNEIYPNVYVWKKCVQSYTEEERKLWPDFNIDDSEIEKLSTSANDSWIRILGNNTPEKIRKKCKDKVIMYSYKRNK